MLLLSSGPKKFYTREEDEQIVLAIKQCTVRTRKWLHGQNMRFTKKWYTVVDRQVAGMGIGGHSPASVSYRICRVLTHVSSLDQIRYRLVEDAEEFLV